MMEAKGVLKIGADGEPLGCAKGLATGCGYKPGAKVCGKCGAMAVQVKKRAAKPMDNTEPAMGDSAPMPEELAAPAVRRRLRRAANMKVKDDAVAVDDPVESAEARAWTLEDISAEASELFGGKVLDAGYADEFDLFVVDVVRKDGRPVEAIFASDGECVGWHLLNEALFSEKTADTDTVIGFEQAAEIAVKTIEGTVVAVDADLLDGRDAYAVEIDGIDGTSYDVYVGLDGEILLVDSFDAEEAAAIKAEVAELDLKAMYSDDERSKLAEEGMALADGSFPIKTVEDLKNAISAFGRAKDKAEAKAHIIKRAEELDASDMIPESWKSEDEADPEDAAEDMAEGETGEKSAADTVEVDDPEFLVSLMELELLAIEEDIDRL